LVVVVPETVVLVGQPASRPNLCRVVAAAAAALVAQLKTALAAVPEAAVAEQVQVAQLEVVVLLIKDIMVALEFNMPAAVAAAQELKAQTELPVLLAA
jgi:hypothetical protein